MIICADDFGLADDVDQATLELVRRGRVTAVSCMVALPCRGNARRELLRHGSRIDIGVHLSMTDHAPTASALEVASLLGSTKFLDFNHLLRRGAMRRIQPGHAAAEIAAQYGKFIAECGRPPDFIDSHLHVHQFPGIRQGLASFLMTLAPETRPYARNTYIPMSKGVRQGVPFLKSWTISIYGRAMRRLLHRRGIATNSGFAGIYDYRQWPNYGIYLQRFVRHMETVNGILMVHPGLEEPWRKAEFEALSGAEFPPGTLSRFSRLLPRP